MLRIFIICLITIYFWYLGTKILKNQKHRIGLFFVTFGGLFYAGIGYGIDPIFKDYLIYYSAFLFCFTISFCLVCNFSSNWFYSSGHEKNILSNKTATVILVLFQIITAFPLIYPEIQLNKLFQPPAPQIILAFNKSLEGENDLLLKFDGYLYLLLFPFYLLSFQNLINKFRYIVFNIVLNLYIQYCVNQYLGRYVFEVFFLFCVLLSWAYGKISVKKAAIITFGSILFIFLISGFYIKIRLGQEASLYELKGIEDSFFGEISFPSQSEKIILSDNRVDLEKYVMWILTLPLPKIITGKFNVSSVNFEIAELVTGLRIGSVGSSAILTSPVTESVYIYGNYMYWFHGIFIGALFGIAIGILSRKTHLSSLWAYFTILILIFWRAGIASILPVFINQFLLFYFFMLLKAFKDRKTQNTNKINVASIV